MDQLVQFLDSLLNLSGSDGVTITQALGAILIAYAGGILSSFTPCVYPMIPITVSVIGGMKIHEHGQKRRWREVLIRGISYVGGMCIVYSFLGMIAGLTGKVFGTLTNSPGWYLGLGLVMTFAALMMMEIIHFDPLSMWERFKHKNPNWFQSKSQHLQHQKEVDALGAFVLGASSGLIAAPCTTPVLTTILAFIAKTQSVFLGFALMASFSIGLGTLLLIVALFAGSLQALPRSGKWLKSIKFWSGIILLLFAEYLIYRAGKLGGI